MKFVPNLSLLVKTNPVEKFIEEYLSKDNIVGYNVYKVTTKPSKIWNVLITSTNYTLFLSKLLDYVLLNTSLKFLGVYFLALELPSIINQIIKEINQGEYNEHLQIFACTLRSNGIKLIVKHTDNIISIQNFDYPQDKSELYIQGIIEQEVEDCLIKYKSYITNLELKVCIFILVNEPLKRLLKNSKLVEHPVVCSSTNILLEKQHPEDDKFLDHLLVKLFNSQKNYPAYNKDLKTISKLNSFSAFVFKPLIIIIIVLTTLIIITKVRTLENYTKLVALNTTYSSSEHERDKIKQKYPYIQNATDLADLYIFEVLLQIPIPILFNLLENFVRSLSPNLFLEGMKWSRLDLNNTLLAPNQYTKTEIFLKFIIYNTSIEDAIKILDQQIADYTSIFDNLEISPTIFTDQIVNLSHRIVIPVAVIISQPIG